MPRIQVVILDPATSKPQSNVAVEARQASDGTIIAVETTNIFGVATFNLSTDEVTFHARTWDTPPLYQITIPGGGIGPFCHDYFIAEDWATEVAAGRGTEGQEFTTFVGHTFRVYSTIDGALEHAAGLSSDSSRSFFICEGTYQETVNRFPPTNSSWYIEGIRGRSIWQAANDSDVLFTKGNNVNGQVHIDGITFDQASVSDGRSISNALNYLGSIKNCDFIGGNADNSTIHVLIFNALAVDISNCAFLGRGQGIAETGGITPIQRFQISGCQFHGDIDVGIELAQGSNISIMNCFFNTDTHDIELRANTDLITIVGNTFLKGIYANGWTSGDNLIISNNTFQLAGSEIGIDLTSLVINTDAITITGNTFAGTGASVIGISIDDAQILSGVIAHNTFNGFTSGNEINGTPGADLDVFHNISEAGAMADIGNPVGHINVAADLPDHTHEDNTEGGGTLTPTDLLWAAATELTISSGAITVTQSHHTIDTEADAATDDLDTINGLVANQLYFFYPANDARTSVIKHNTGNLLCIGNQDFALNDAHDFIWAFSPDGSTIYVGGPHNAPVFISGTEPTSKQDGQLWLDTDATGTGGLGVLNVTTISSSDTLTTSQTVVLCDASGGAITVTLLAASGNDGRHYHIKKIDSSGNAVTIDGDGSETIDGETTQVITMQYNSINVVCDGSAWNIL